MITIVRAIQTSSACPSQWDAWDADGQYYYLRFRHGHGTVQAMNRDEPDYQSELVGHFQDDDPWNGSIELEEFVERAGLALSPRIEYKGFGQYFAEALEAVIKEQTGPEESEVQL